MSTAERKTTKQRVTYSLLDISDHHPVQQVDHRTESINEWIFEIHETED